MAHVVNEPRPVLRPEGAIENREVLGLQIGGALVTPVPPTLTVMSISNARHGQGTRGRITVPGPVHSGAPLRVPSFFTAPLGATARRLVPFTTITWPPPLDCGSAKAEDHRVPALPSTAALAGVPHEMILLDLYNALRPLDEITGATVVASCLAREVWEFAGGEFRSSPPLASELDANILLRTRSRSRCSSAHARARAPRSAIN